MANKEFLETDILALDQRYRATFINSLGGFKSFCLIGTQNKEGHTNLAAFSSLFHLGANPALVGFIVRPDVAKRHTLNNILETGALTINHVNEVFYTQAHQTSARYAAEVSEFAATGLTEAYIEGINAPFVAESHVKLAATFVRKIDIAENGTIMMIARIIYVSAPEKCLLSDGFLDIELAGTVTCSGLDSYHTTRRLARLTYAKPDTVPQQVDRQRLSK
jgi:flavin reductase (DIM6/NTAB) family NADH-FMN oxidoreductase RutF